MSKQKSTQHGVPMFWACNFHVLNYQFNEQSVVDAKIRASAKDLPVHNLYLSLSGMSTLSRLIVSQKCQN